MNDDLQQVVDFHDHLVTEYGQAESKWKLVNVLRLLEAESRRIDRRSGFT